MSAGNFAKNAVVFTVITTANLFSFYLLNFMNKDIEGNIFTNYYLEGIAEIIAILIMMPLPKRLGVKWSFFLCYSLALFFTFMYYIHEMDIVNIRWIESFGYPESPFETGSDEDLYHYRKCIIPIWIFLIKIFIFAPANATLNDHLIFPS